MKMTDIVASEILERIIDGFFALNSNWEFTYVNEEAARLLFRSQKDLIGKNVWDEFPEAVGLLFYKQYLKAVKEQVPVKFDAYFPPLDTWYDVRAYPSKNGLTVYFLDVTNEKKASSQNKQHYKSLFEQNPDAVFSFDLNGQYLSVNSAMEKLLGYSEQEFLQLSYAPLVAEEDLAKTANFYEKAANGATQHYETKALHKDGHIVHVQVTNMPIIVDHEIVGVYGIAKDISNLKLTEKKLVESEKLSAVGQLSASIAHEIRNPLTAIKGFLQLMNASKENVQETYLSVMAKEIERIEAITGELLVLAKPQAQNFKLENLQEILKDVTALIGSQALMNNVEIKVKSEKLPLINCIGNQLKQVFINLLKNSIESMVNGGLITVTLQIRDNQMLLIQITDQGYGMTNEAIEKIGLPFYTTKQSGTGLGMMTSFKIIESHSGTMEISSEVGVGTTVSIYLPINPSD